MMLIQYRLKRHSDELEKKAIKDIVNYLRLPECKRILDTRNAKDIDTLLDWITKEVAKKQELNKSPINIDVVALGNEVKEDLLMLCFTFDYVQEYQDDLDLTFDQDTYSDYIDQFRSYLQAEQLTELTTNEYEPGMKGVENAFKDAQDAWQIGRTTEKMSIGDLFVAEKTGPINPSQAMQVQTLPSIDPGFMTFLKGFGGAMNVRRRNDRFSPTRLRRTY